MKIYKIEFHRLGEVCSTYEVGNYGVLDIENHRAQGEGDRWYWTIIFEDGHHEMLFNVDRVFLNH